VAEGAMQVAAWEVDHRDHHPIPVQKRCLGESYDFDHFLT
jgi:hypothetical protein